jgi:hypothetical protein
VGDPEEVIEFLGVARVGIIGAFVFIFDVGTGGLHTLASFSGGVAYAAIDRATGSFGKTEGGEGEWKYERESCRSQCQAKNILFHLGPPKGTLP